MPKSIFDTLIEDCPLEVRVEMVRLRELHGALAMALTLAVTEMLVNERKVGPWGFEPPTSGEVDARSQEFIKTATKLLASTRTPRLGRIEEGH